MTVVTLIVMSLALICAIFVAALAATYVWSSNADRRNRSLRMVLLLLGEMSIRALPTRRGSGRYGQCCCGAESVTWEVDHQTDE
ncbi:hypothetical protein [Phytohabitans sp. LJ34]|uniref:hypothetical protein n=1 Tax=Phytohabitans sp. LJ34 TaxID=3452217 RepID=UPI003F89F98E